VKFRRQQWTGHRARIGKDEIHTNFDCEVSRKSLFGRPRMSWQNNTKVDLREICYEDGKWIKLAHGRSKCGFRY
jgi:hypothetical protein